MEHKRNISGDLEILIHLMTVCVSVVGENKNIRFKKREHILLKVNVRAHLIRFPYF